MRISDWSSDVCSSDLRARAIQLPLVGDAVMFGHCPYPVEDICPDELRDQQKAQYLPAEGRQEDQAVEKQRPQPIANAQPQAEVVTEASGIVEIGEGRQDAAVDRKSGV